MYISYEFEDNYVYIGLTYNLKKRNKRHLSDVDSSVYKHINSSNKKYILKQKTNYIDINDAKEMEEKILLKYKNDKWNILNKMKTGNLGGTYVIWDFDKCKLDAVKYDNMSHFYKMSRYVYDKSKNNGWLNEISSHMDMNKKERKPRGYWTYDKCLLETQKYNTKKELREKSHGCYNVITKNKWVDELCFHMIELKKPNGYWSKIKCKEIALTCNNIKEFKNKYVSAYNSVKRNGWIIEFYNIYNIT